MCPLAQRISTAAATARMAHEAPAADVCAGASNVTAPAEANEVEARSCDHDETHLICSRMTRTGQQLPPLLIERRKRSSSTTTTGLAPSCQIERKQKRQAQLPRCTLLHAPGVGLVCARMAIPASTAESLTAAAQNKYTVCAPYGSDKSMCFHEANEQMSRQNCRRRCQFRWVTCRPFCTSGQLWQSMMMK